LDQKPEARAIVRAIISLAGALHIDIVAEGIETAKQLLIIQAEGCREVQGFFFSRPQPASAVGEIISQCDS
jgi:EAL domain-containing protein (putative c-di-GMP-specific phosphodiesterase class I)